MDLTRHDITKVCQHSGHGVRILVIGSSIPLGRLDWECNPEADLLLQRNVDDRERNFNLSLPVMTRLLGHQLKLATRCGTLLSCPLLDLPNSPTLPVWWEGRCQE